MNDFINNIKRHYKAASILMQFIYINVGVFIFIKLSIVILHLFLKEPFFLKYIEMPSSQSQLLYRPWTLITYMFVHYDFLHILFNMLWLYWFGKIFLNFFSSRQLGGIYIMGGISGALFFLLAYNIFPYFNTVADGSYLIGASASVMTIVFAASFYEKNYTINLLFIGNIKLIYLAFGAFILDFLAITSTNAGGHIAHIGGACLGILFAGQYRKGKDITNPVNRMIDKINNLFTKKPAFKVHRNNTKQKTTTKRRPETDREYLQRKSNENREIDIILDKLKKSGYSSLSDKEKQKLFDASKK